MDDRWAHDVMDVSGDWHAVVAVAAVLMLHWVLVGVVVVVMFPVTRARRGSRTALLRARTVARPARRRRDGAQVVGTRRIGGGQGRGR